MAIEIARTREAVGALRSFTPAAMIGLIAGIDNIAAALAMGALIFAGPLASGMGLGVGVILLGGAILALVVALRSVLPNSVALVQETTIAILAAAIAIIGTSALATGAATGFARPAPAAARQACRDTGAGGPWM